MIKGEIMKRLIFGIMLSLLFAFSAYAQSANRITEEDALAIAKQTIVDRELRPMAWFDSAAISSKFNNAQNYWQVTFMGAFDKQSPSGNHLWGGSVFISPEGEVYNVFIDDFRPKN